MGITKQYLRYASAGLFNVIGSPRCNVVFVKLKQTYGRFLAVGACENILVWDTRKGAKVLELQAGSSEVCVLCPSPNDKYLAAGYTNGSIRIFDLLSTECLITFDGHKSAVTCLSYDHDGVRLVSGSKDTEIVVWDVINESGMFRLRGHKGVVTQCRFLRTRNVLVSSSKDTFVKFWDLDIQHCFKTMVGHRGEVWDFVLGKEDGRVITGAADSELRIWDLKFHEKSVDAGAQPKKPKISTSEADEGSDNEIDDEDGDDLLSCIKCGSMLRQGRNHVSSMRMDSSYSLLACHGNSDVLELFRFLSEAEIKKRLAKKQKKAKKRLLKEQVVSGATSTADPVSEEPCLSVKDETSKLGIIKASAKIKSFDFVLENEVLARFVLLLNNNSLEIYEFTLGDKIDVKLRNKVALPGHRSDVRTLSFSSDNTAVLSASGESMKIWNRVTGQCIRTTACEYALCSMFVPGDRHCIIGTKSGQLQIFDIASNTCLECVDAHQGALWTVCQSPDQRGFVSGGADKEVKFWEFELVADRKSPSQSKRLSAIHTRTLQLSEDVLCTKLSQDGRLLAVSLLDSTVKVFFVDTLKFFLSLYGHKFPVLCMDISDDSSIIVTGSADRNVKIWGLDFGDCHRSLFAHDDSIMCLQFVPKTHMFFTGGKDGVLKQWDADNFEKIMTLKGHHGEVWALAVSPNGQHVVSSSHDKSIRLWEKTEEILVLDEQREVEREEEFETTLATGEETVIPGETNTETGLASKKSIDTLKAAEKIMESVDIYREEMAKLQEHALERKASKRNVAQPPAHPLMMAHKTPTPAHFVLHVLKLVKSSELEEALLILPFSYVTEYLTILHGFLQKNWCVELSCRCIFFLLRVHHGEITSNRVLLPVIDQLRITANERVSEMRNTIGFNMAGLNFLQREIESKEEVQLFFDATQKVEEKKKRRRRQARLQRAILAL